MPVLMFLFFAATGISITSPKPIAPTDARIDGNAMTWKSAEIAIRIEPLDRDAFFAWIKQHGVSEAMIEKQGLEKMLTRLAVFRFSLYNQGEERLVFNPEQVTVNNRSGVIATQVKATDFLFAAHGHSDPEIEKLAHLFGQETLELAPNQKVGRVIAFRALDGKFPKKIKLVINRLYYGIVTLGAACEFQVRYLTP